MQNIPQDEGLVSVKEFLGNMKEKQVTTDTMRELTELGLKSDNFEKRMGKLTSKYEEQELAQNLLYHLQYLLEGRKSQGASGGLPGPPTFLLLMFFIINDIKKKLKKIRYRLHKKSLNGTSNISHRSNIEQASKTIKIIGHILKNKKKKWVHSWDYIINHSEKDYENEK